MSRLQPDPHDMEAAAASIPLVAGLDQVRVQVRAGVGPLTGSITLTRRAFPR
jgi:hypothetical protein